MVTVEGPSVISTSWLPSRLDWFRVAAALVLTASLIPFAWGYTWVMYQLSGGINKRWVAALAVGIAVNWLLLWGVARPHRLGPWRRTILLLAGLISIAAGAVLAWRASSPLSNRLLVVPLFVASGLWAAWLAWRPAIGGSIARWAIVLAILLTGPVAFARLLRIEEMTGDAGLIFGMRGAAPRRTTVTLDTVEQGTARLTTTSKDWPGFWGPGRDGVVRGVALERDWQAHPPMRLWRIPVGAGWGSFAIVGDYAFTQEQRDANECVVCYELRTGKQVWCHTEATQYTGIAGPGPRATPTVVDGAVYAIGGVGRLLCLEGTDGRVRWWVDTTATNQATPPAHGVCGSPLVVKDLVIVCPNSADGKSLVAYRTKDGSLAWRSGDGPASYATPGLVTIAGVPQVLIFDGNGAFACDPAIGERFWSHAWYNSERIAASQPIVLPGNPARVLITTGYGKGSTLVEVERDAKGTWSTRPVWSGPVLKTKFTSAVAKDGMAYGLDDGILVGVDIATGQQKWKKREGRFGHGQLIMVGNLLLVQEEQDSQGIANVVLVEVSVSGMKILGRYPALEGKTWNNLAFAPPVLLCRNDHEATGIELPLETPPK